MIEQQQSGKELSRRDVLMFVGGGWLASAIWVAVFWLDALL